ncbi:P-loop containing nucleoside triphosphate hydrolase protein [Lenzites betulinus]|nr:P-loop containing nucleoside triphosphate hydrolase protein [Lenzites betulinus]
MTRRAYICALRRPGLGSRVQPPTAHERKLRASYARLMLPSIPHIEHMSTLHAVLVLIGKRLWTNTLLVPVYCAIFSAIVLLVTGLKDVRRTSSRPIYSATTTTIAVCRLAQLLTILGLLGTSVYSLVRHNDTNNDLGLGVSVAQCALYIYLGILELLTLSGNAPLEFCACASASYILAVTWIVYMYRDVWPLATIDTSPADVSEGKLLWVKLVLLSLGGVVIPLLTPRKYLLLTGPNNERIEPAPEQTASILSLVIFGFLEPLVWKAWCIPRLTYEMLPPLPAYDYLANLRRQSFPHLDPLQSKLRRHVGFGLIRVFWAQLGNLAILNVLFVITSFAAPVSVNQLLTYMETGGAGAQIRPWFWIALFFVGSSLRDILVEYFIFNHTRINIRVQAIITDLVFEHALRIRVKAGTTDVDDGDVSQGLNSRDENEVVAEHPGVQDESPADTDDAPGTPPKGKGKHTGVPAPRVKAAETDAAEGSSGSGHLIGRINNLVSGDLRTLDDLSQFFIFFTVEWPLQVTLCTIFLYKVLGWSAILGIIFMVCMLPIPGYLAKNVEGTQAAKMKRTDERVQAVTEMMNVIRMIKLFGWEDRTAAQLDAKREVELLLVRRTKMLTSCINLCNYALPYFVMLATFFTYTVIMKKELTASTVFSSMTVFDMLRDEMHSFFYIMPQVMQASVSLKRITDFLWNTELIDEFTEENVPAGEDILPNSNNPPDHDGVVGIRHASFTWSNDTAPSRAPGGTRKRRFVLTVDDELLFQRGKLNLIVGPTGSGKTSLLMALLGELHYIPTGPDAFVSLPRADGIAYAAQESWVQNDTIRNNILFGAAYDQVRYDKVLEQCALKRDLALFDAGDHTEVGEKGITLSGGQKARITLARAVYSTANILLLDDILAALDVHTAKWIVEKCLKGDLLQGRTIVLVTHNIAMVAPIADFVVDMGSDGRILSQGSLDNVLAQDSHLVKEVLDERAELEKAEQAADVEKPEDAPGKQASGKLVVAEEMEDGRVGWSAFRLYFANTSNRPTLFWAVYVSAHVVHNLLINVQAWYLGSWASQYETHPGSEVSLQHYLSRYAAMIVVSMAIAVFFVVWFLYGSIKASRIIHQKLVRSVLGTTLRWLDRTPTARIITRCTEDIQTVDDGIQKITQMVVERTAIMVLKVVAVVVFSPVFLAPSVVVAALGALLGNVYMKGQMSTKRELSTSKAPVMGHFSAAVSGITSIRAYGAQEAFREELFKRVDRYSRVYIMHENFNRWMSARMDFVGTVYATSLAVYLVYVSRLSASDTGFSLNMATAFSAIIFAVIRTYNAFEINSTSLERIQQYLTVEQEPKPSPDGVPPAYWPASGHLVVENLSARYSSDGPKVLHDISFEIASGERVGIVGRTGSGKSSLTLALLRCIITEGHVWYDGLATDKLNLDALHSNITIIPQVPELLSGTLRQNLDPFGEHEDAVLNDALRSAGLFNLQEEGDESRITLDTEIAGGGANLSVGQRQILALARAIIRRSKLLILDEDYETDAIIQTYLRTELGKDVTLLTVAHRLQTIMDADKIMVLDAGHIVEFGKPSELLKSEKGMLRALVDESGDREKLYVMAAGASAS